MNKRLLTLLPRAFLLVVVFWICLGPLLSLIYGAIRTGTPGEPGSTFTAEHVRTIYLGLFQSGPWQHAVADSFMLAVSVSIIAVAVGTLLAWLVVRTDLPHKRAFEIVLILPLFYSSLIELIGWTMLASPRSGYINVLWRLMTGTDSTAVDIYTLTGIIFVMSTQFIPYVILISIGQMRSMDGVFEEAAAVAGARLWIIMRTVTLPILLPGIAAAGMYVFVLSMEVFTVPGLLGTRINLDTVAYNLYENVVGFSAKLPLAAAGGTFMLLIAAIALLIYRSLTSMGQRYVTVGGRGFKSGPIALGKYRAPVLALCCLFVLITTILPFVAVVLRSLMKVRGDTLGALSLDNFSDLLSAPYFMPAVTNSLLLSFAAATVCTILGIGLAVWKVRNPDPVVKVCDYLISIPIALPGIILGIGLLWSYVATPLYMTLGILLLVMVTRFTGLGSQVASSGLMQIDRSLEEAASISGASALRARLSITIPILKPVIASMWLLVFLMTARELSASVMLYGIGSETLPILTWKYLADGLYGTSSALAVVQVLGITVVVVLFRLMVGTDLNFIRRRGNSGEAA